MLNNFTHIKNFLTFDDCDDILRRFSSIFDKKLTGISYDENKDSNEIKLGDLFYSKKNGVYEVSKFNIPLESISNITSKVASYIIDNIKRPFTFKVAQLVAKKNFDNNNMPPHVDNLYDMNKQYLNFGIYLTPSDSTNSVYFYENSYILMSEEYVPKQQDLDKFKKTYVIADKGDLIIHNSYCVHGSNYNNLNEGRFTLYVKAEFSYDN